MLSLSVSGAPWGAAVAGMPPAGAWLLRPPSLLLRRRRRLRWIAERPGCTHVAAALPATVIATATLAGAETPTDRGVTVAWMGLHWGVVCVWNVCKWSVGGGSCGDTLAASSPTMLLDNSVRKRECGRSGDDPATSESLREDAD